MNREAFIAKSENGQIIQKTRLEPNIDHLVGRSRKSCMFTLNSTRVSREHCIVSYDRSTGLFLITDVSTNGTFLMNGKRLEKGIPFTVNPQTEVYFSDPENKVIFLTE